MEVPVLSKGRILFNLADYLPTMLFTTFLFFVVGSAALFSVIRGSVEDELGRDLSLAVVGMITLVPCILYTRFVVNRLARYRLALDDDGVVVRGQTAAGLVEKRYPLNGIRMIVFGEKADAVQPLLAGVDPIEAPDTAALRRRKNLKPGRLLIQGTVGDEEVFYSVDKAFDREALAEFARELRKRGVSVGSVST